MELSSGCFRDTRTVKFVERSLILRGCTYRGTDELIFYIR